jgi:hypothetical protein
MTNTDPRDVILLYGRLQELLDDLEAGEKNQLNWRLMYQYDALYRDVTSLVDAPKFGAISPSSGYRGLFLGRVLAPLSFPPPDTIVRLYSKAMLLERYLRNFICYQHPGVASHIWGTEVFGSTSQESDLQQGYVASCLIAVKESIERSKIEECFKQVALYDVDQALTACKAGAFKASIVMLGAVLEGLMLGTIRRTDVIARLRADAAMQPRPANYPRKLRELGVGDPQIANKMARELDFERYKDIICYLIPGIEKLKVESIQSFRNAVHPWSTVTESTIYGEPDLPRVASHAVALQILAKKMLAWNP